MLAARLEGTAVSYAFRIRDSRFCGSRAWEKRNGAILNFAAQGAGRLLLGPSPSQTLWSTEQILPNR